MRIAQVVSVVALLGASGVAVPMPARADGGQVAAGIAGGLLGGLLLGGALASHSYYAPAPVYSDPIYVAPPPDRCYWTWGEPYWDDWRGVWRRPRVRLCD